MRPADQGGDSILVDGFNLGDVLRERNPAAFQLLATQPQPFHRLHGGRIDQRTRAPAFVTDETGAIVGFRFHTRSAAPLDAPVALMESLCAANYELSTMMMSEVYQARFRLEAGDAVLFDNHRVMHSRAAFSDSDRLLKICNVSREQFHEQLRLTARGLGFIDEAEQVLTAGVTG